MRHLSAYRAATEQKGVAGFVWIFMAHYAKALMLKGKLIKIYYRNA